jgi:predicted O-methyltransferase YrrM
MNDDIDKLRISYKEKGYALLRYDDKPLGSYPYDSPWIDDEGFTKVFASIRDYTLIDRTRAYALYQVMDQIKNVPGDVLEVGTWRGGTAGIFTQMLPDKTIYLADTFEGVVKSSSWEHYKDKAHDDTSEELVKDFLSNKLGVSNFKILKGIFPEDTGTALKADSLAFVYLDVDVYESTKDAFNYVWDKVSLHGIVVFDDYGMISACAGIKKFVDEIKDDEDKIFIENLNGQAVIIKAAL